MMSQAASSDRTTDAPIGHGAETAQLDAIIGALRTVHDPEIPVNIFDLGLIYQIAEQEPGRILIQMTLTAPNCPVAGSLPGTVQQAVETVDGVDSCQVDLVWDPPWTPERMSEEAKLTLGMF